VGMGRLVRGRGLESGLAGGLEGDFTILALPTIPTFLPIQLRPAGGSGFGPRLTELDSGVPMIN
jgi:hypothetical protein